MELWDNLDTDDSGHVPGPNTNNSNNHDTNSTNNKTSSKNNNNNHNKTSSLCLSLSLSSSSALFGGVLDRCWALLAYRQYAIPVGRVPGMRRSEKARGHVGL